MTSEISKTQRRRSLLKHISQRRAEKDSSNSEPDLRIQGLSHVFQKLPLVEMNPSSAIIFEHEDFLLKHRRDPRAIESSPSFPSGFASGLSLSVRNKDLFLSGCLFAGIVCSIVDADMVILCKTVGVLQGVAAYQVLHKTSKDAAVVYFMIWSDLAFEKFLVENYKVSLLPMKTGNFHVSRICVLLPYEKGGSLYSEIPGNFSIHSETKSFVGPRVWSIRKLSENHLIDFTASGFYNANEYWKLLVQKISENFSAEEENENPVSYPFGISNEKFPWKKEDLILLNEFKDYLKSSRKTNDLEIPRRLAKPDSEEIIRRDKKVRRIY